MTTVADTPTNGLRWLLIAAIVTVIAWQIPGANYVLYPFAILSTWFHEMAHGLTAFLVGGNFRELVINSDGSGVASYSIDPNETGRIGRALIAAGGPLGPPIAGTLFILCGRRRSLARTALVLLGGLLLLSALLWVRSPFGLAAVGLLGAAILLLAVKGAVWWQEFGIQFLGVQACISTYRQVGYLFKDYADIDGEWMMSDTMQIQQQLWLPYWLWGGLIIALSLSMLALGLWLAYRGGEVPTGLQRGGGGAIPQG